jgi:xanthine dehydrogenase accessory factor
MKALIVADGTMEGWVGGSCTHPIVVREALAALGSGAPRLICLAPEGQDDGREGVIRHLMTCHSGGTLEIYIEPVLPKPQLILIGEAPLVNTLSELGRLQGFGVLAVEPGTVRNLEARITPSTYVVVTTMGTSDEEALERVIGRGAAYVALVSSRKRAEAVFAYLRSRGVPSEELQRIKVPAGLDIGAVTPEEIALSIMAEIIQVRRARPIVQTEAPATVEATDPVCGMTVGVATTKYSTAHQGVRYYFCSAHCKAAFEREPAQYVTAGA